MANKKISELTQIGVANLTDTDQLVVVDVESSATRRMSVSNLKAHITGGSEINGIQSNLDTFATYANATFSSGSGSAGTVQSNLHAFASYANATFGSGAGDADTVQNNLHAFAATANTNIDIVQDNVATNATTITVNKTITDHFGTYANTTFGSGADPVQSNLHTFATTANTNINTVQDNVATNAATITVNKTITDQFGTYANTTFALDSSVDTVQSNVDSIVTTDGIDNLTLHGNLIPATGSAYSLGSASARWKTAFVDAATVDLDGLLLSNDGGTFIIDDGAGNTTQLAADTGNLTLRFNNVETNINTVQSNVTSLSDELDAFASYANTTFETNPDSVQSNLHSLGASANASINLVQSNVHSLGASANASINLVQSNLHSFAATNNTAHTTLQTNIDTVQSNVDAMIQTSNGNVILQSGSSFLPEVSGTQDLGGPYNGWRDLWLGGNTIRLGGVTRISASSTGAGIQIAGDGGATAELTAAAGNVAQRFNNVIHGLDSANTNIDLVQANAAYYASVANTNINLVQANAAYYASTTNTTITTNKAIADQFGTYANATFATTSYVDSEIAGLVDSAPATLDTLNELAAALGNDANLSVTLTNAIGTVSANAATNSTNLDTLGTYANTTFATNTKINTVQDNVATNASSISTLETNINTVQDNVATNATTITTNKTISDNFGTYANSTFATLGGDPRVESVLGNLNTYASYANSTFATDTNLNTVQDNVATNASSISTLETNINTVQDNVATNATSITALDTEVTTFATYANSTFGSGSGDANLVEANLDSYASYANSTFLTGTAANTSFSGNVAVAEKLVVTDRVSVHTYTVTNSGFSAYVIDGSNNADLHLIRGLTYRFDLNVSGHPFEIRVSDGGSAYNTGVVGNQKESGILEFTVPDEAPETLVYQCIYHSGMVGNIYIVDAKEIATTITTNKTISDTLGTYANTTFATDTNLNVVQDNVATNASSISTINTNINTVQDNVATNATTITTNKSVLDTLGTYANATFATSSYVDTEVAGIVNSAPATLDTLNELAAALGNDANLSVTLTNAIGTVSANAATNSTNLDTLGTYANTTFATDTNLNVVQDNVATNASSISTLETNLNTVQDNVATNATTITTNKSVLDTLGTYANTTFATDTNLNVVQDNVATNASSISTLETNLNTVQDNVATNATTITTNKTISDTLGTYANTTFATDTNLDVVQSNLTVGLGNLKYFRFVDVDGEGQAIASANADTLSFVSGSSMNVQVSGSTITFNAENVAAGGGVVTQAFKTFSVAGESSIVADGPADTFTFEAGAGINLTTDSANDKIIVTSINTSELDTFGTYANATFATDTNLNVVQDNVATNATTITTNKSVLDTLGTYANTTFATDTNLNVVQDNVATNASSISTLETNLNTVQDNVATNVTTITTNKSISDAFGTYANSTFATVGGDPRVQSVLGNLNAYASYANSTFATDTNLNTVQDNVATNTSSITDLTAVVNQAGTYANTTFATTSSVTTNYLNKTTGTAQSVVADITFQNDVTIDGDLTVTGNTTIVNQTTVNTEDGLIHLANNNESSDTLDIGFFGHYYDGTTSNHAGFYRDAGTKEFYIFNTYNDGNEDTVNVNPADSTFTLANVNIKVAKANTVQTDILTASGFSYPTVDGTERESIITDANGNLSFGTVQRSRSIALSVKNDTVSTIAKSKAVYITGVSGNTPTIGLADSSNSITMPAFGLVEEDILPNATGRVVIFGEIKGLDTTGFNPNETLYISTSGNLSNTKPIGSSSLVQNLGKVTKVSSSGILEVMGAGRTNDIPNLDQYEVFIGDGDYYERRQLRSSDIIGVDGIQSNAAAFASYANSTFATISGLNLVQTNLHAFATTANTNIDAVQSNVDLITGIAPEDLSNLAAIAGAIANDAAFATTVFGKIDIVQDNVATNATTITVNKSVSDTFGTYANSTFATDTNLNTVQDNVATNATTITVNKSVSDQFGTYANSTFATSSYVDSEIAGLVDSAPATLDTLNELAAALGNDANLSVTLTNAIGTVSANAATNSTNINTVQDNVATNATTITTNKSITDTYASYANSTFATDTNLNTVQDNVATNASSISTLETNINTVQDNVVTNASSITALDTELTTFASYANSTFASGVSQASVDLVQDNVATNASSITALNAEVDQVGTYSNLTFATKSSVNTLQNNVSALALSETTDQATEGTTTLLAANLVPASDQAYDLGSSTKAWKDLWLSGSTIRLGGIRISATSTGISVDSGTGTSAAVLSGPTGNVELRLSNLVHGLTSANTNINIVQSNVTTLDTTVTNLNSEVDQLGSYANSTFATDTNLNTVQDNVATNASSISTLETNINTVSSNVNIIGGELDSFGSYANATFATVGGDPRVQSVLGNLNAYASYANSTFATDTNLNTVQDNVATNASSISALETNINTVQDNVATNATTITTNKTISDQFGTYANSTFATDTNLNTVQDNVATNASSISALETNINTVQDNVATNATTITTNKTISDQFGTYANSTFATSSYVDSEIAGLVDSAPATLDTLNELAAALGNDANLSVTLTNAIGTVSANAAINSTNINTVQDNVATNATTIIVNKSVSDQFGTYANSTFATDTNLNTVQDNVATNATTITVNKSISDQFGTYANSTFATSAGIDTYGIKYNFDTATTAADPGTGDFRFSIDWTTGSPGSSYSAYVSETDNDTTGIGPLLDTLTTSTNTNKALIVLYKKSNPTINAKFYVTGQTDNGTWRTLDIEYIDRDNWASISNGDEVFMTISLIGDQGDSVTANTNINTVQSNVTIVETNLDTFASYANSTFALDTSLNTVQDNVATNASSITALDTELTTFASYANTTFGSGAGDADSVQSNLHAFAAYVNTAAGYSSDQFISSASSNTFSLGDTVTDANNILVSVSGVLQSPNDDYIVSGNSLILNNTDPIPSSVKVEVRNLVRAGRVPYGTAGLGWNLVTTNAVTLTSNASYFVDVSNGPKTVILPASPILGSTVKIVDVAGLAEANNITVNGNSEKIQRDSSDLTVASNASAFTLVYSTTAYGWILSEV